MRWEGEARVVWRICGVVWCLTSRLLSWRWRAPRHPSLVPASTSWCTSSEVPPDTRPSSDGASVAAREAAVCAAISCIAAHLSPTCAQVNVLDLATPLPSAAHGLAGLAGTRAALHAP